MAFMVRDARPAALLTMRVLDLILRRRESAVSKDESPDRRVG
jgi:hypothetical protein